jgi:hypothetical protein
LDDSYAPRPPEQGAIPVAVGEEEEMPSPAAILKITREPYWLLVSVKNLKKPRHGARRHGLSRHPGPGAP